MESDAFQTIAVRLGGKDVYFVLMGERTGQGQPVVRHAGARPYLGADYGDAKPLTVFAAEAFKR